MVRSGERTSGSLTAFSFLTRRTSRRPGYSTASGTFAPLAGCFGSPQSRDREDEHHREGGDDPPGGGQVLGAGPRERGGAGLNDMGRGVEGSNRVHPTAEELTRHVDRSQEEEEEDGNLHQRRCLEAAEPQGNAR